MAVLLYHFKVPGFGGGFLGVDLFFVISGFLMTTIVSNGLEKRNFSLLTFYMARVRRIVPALLTLLAVLLLLGWFFLPTADYRALGEQSTSAAAFYSNFFFWRTSGYFRAKADSLWLLHTWTLGVEFQYYILLPLYLLFVHRLRSSRKGLIVGHLALFALSFSLNLYLTSRNPNAAFYLLPMRAWEFLSGGIVALISKEFSLKKGLKQIGFVAGFLLLFLGMVWIDTATSWPSGWALLPVVGTALIILSQREKSILTAHPLAQWLGARSYSIYFGTGRLWWATTLRVSSFRLCLSLLVLRHRCCWEISRIDGSKTAVGNILQPIQLLSRWR